MYDSGNLQSLPLSFANLDVSKRVVVRLLAGHTI